MARSKMFKNPSKSLVPEEEEKTVLMLTTQYEDRMRALVKYLAEDHLKNSEVGEAARQEMEKEEEEHRQLLVKNEEENLKVAARRAKRLEEEAMKRKLKIETEIKEIERKESERMESVESFVMKEVEEIENMIKPENIQSAIEEALDNHVDYEFAIDTEGHIYRGRGTKSKKVPHEKREKLTLATKEDHKSIFLELNN